MPLGWLLSVASDIAAPVTHAVRTATSSPNGRRTFVGHRRIHLEIKGIHEPGATVAARDIERRLTDLPGVTGVEINSALGRVAIDHDPDLADTPTIAGTIAEAEVEHGLDTADVAPASETHPGNADAVLREVGALGAGLLGFGYAAAGALLPVPAAPPLVPAVTSLVDSVPWLRAQARDRLGGCAVDTTLTLGGAVSQALAQRPLSIVTDVCNRWSTSREAIARHQAWQEWDRDAAPGAHRCEPVPVSPRPTPLPDGPVERVANLAGGAALAGYASVLATTRSPQRALAALIAGTPRPAKAGRDAFAAQLTSGLSDRDTLVLRPDALRRLDRVDTVLFDSSVLLTGRRVIDTVTPLDTSADTAELFTRASDLVDLQDPTARVEHDGWAVGPLVDFPVSDDVRELARTHGHRGAAVAVLSYESTPVALVTVDAELDPLAEALVDAAQATATVVVAGVGSRLDRRLPISRCLAGGSRTAQSVRELQSEGHVVAVISDRAQSALAAADVGIGLLGDSTPWISDVVCRHPATAHLLLHSLSSARAASRNAAALAAAGSSLAALLAAFGPARGAPGRASLPIQGATLCALGAGTWTGIQATNRPPPVPEQRTLWHAMSSSAVLTTLSSAEEGLSTRAANQRQVPHTAEPSAGTGVVAATVEGLINPITPVLGVGAAISAAMGSVLDATLIGGVLLISAAVDGIQKVATDKELRRLLDAGQLPARLRRDGQVGTVPADHLVPGDVVELRAGDGVPADCRLLTAEYLEVDESSLTGESHLVTKSVHATTAPALADRTSMLYQGTAVASGVASAIVVATGVNTEIGRSTQDAPHVPGGTGGVEARMSELTRTILPLSVGAGVVLFGVDLLRRFPLAETVGRAVGLAVAAVPEGLPFVATLAELAAARRLSRRGVLVRTPATIEALGRVDVLCFDKTGTLTQGRISLREVSDGRSSLPVEDVDSDGHHGRIIGTAVNASPRPDGHPVAHLTDRAVLDGAEALGVAAADSVVHAELPFEPSRGFHAVRCDGLLHIKGAPEVVLDRCTRWRRADGSTVLDADARADIDAEVERLALSGYRLLAIAERPASHRNGLDEGDVHDLEFVGLLGLADPVHPTATDAVRRLRAAGVDMVIITGDHPSTAEAIASELDMLAGKRVMTGGELDELDDEQLAGELPKVSVFARVSPSQKARIVRRLRESGRIVAMTGDGANDVPAITLSHVGIAFGSRATSAAREAADLVVADDRIETLVDGIAEGRGMWMSVHDALSVLLGGNLGEIGFSVGAGLFGGGAALNARQLLVVNMLTDVLPAIAIAVRPPPHATPERLLAEGPDASLGSTLTRDVYARAVATASAAGLAWLAARPVSTVGQARTTGLVALVAAQLAQTLAVRGTTPLVLAAGVSSLLILIGVVQVPGVSQFFGSQPLLPHQWTIAVVAAAVSAAGVVLWQSLPSSSPDAVPAVTA